jgi:hypothetical protein
MCCSGSAQWAGSPYTAGGERQFTEDIVELNGAARCRSVRSGSPRTTLYLRAMTVSSTYRAVGVQSSPVRPPWRLARRSYPMRRRVTLPVSRGWEFPCIGSM